MASISVSDGAVDNLKISDFFDPDAAFNYGTDDELSLESRDGYELVFQGDDFAYDRNDAPTDGTVTDVFLYDPDGDLVGQIDNVSFSLETYYDRVAVDGRPGAFTTSLLSGADVISGGDADDYLEGFGGNDSIAGGNGHDLLAGDAGNDTLIGGDGEDDIDGGSGNDRVSGGDDNDLIYGAAGNDTLSGDDGHDTIRGEDGNDRIDGGVGLDDLSGGAGADTISGAGGYDLIGGGAQNDLLSGGSGSDEIYGGSGADTLIGGTGHDTLAGGTGADQFRFGSSTAGSDVILDFQHGVDKLVFTAAGFANLGANFELVVGEDPTAATNRGAFLFDVDSHQLSYDADGSGAGGDRLIATLDDVTTLTRSDFLIV